MGNALLFTACLLGAAVLGGFIGSCCASKRRDDGGHEARIAELEERLDALATHCMDEGKQIKKSLSAAHTKTNDLYDQLSVLKAEGPEWEILTARINELEFLVGDTPTGGLLGRVGALEEAARKEAQGEPR